MVKYHRVTIPPNEKVAFGIILLALWTAGVVWVTSKNPIQTLFEPEQPAPAVSSDIVPDNPNQPHSRFVIDTIDQATIVDLNNDGVGEALVISHYADLYGAVFIYYGLYKFSPEGNIWEEAHANKLNILSLPPELYAGQVDDPQEFKRKIVQFFATNLSQIRSVGDLTGDEYPEVLVTTRFQGKNESLYYLVVGLGTDNFRYVVAEGELPFGTVEIKGTEIVETYKNLETDQFMKVIKSWDPERLFFIKNYEELAPPPTYESIPDRPEG